MGMENLFRIYNFTPWKACIMIESHWGVKQSWKCDKRIKYSGTPAAKIVDKFIVSQLFLLFKSNNIVKIIELECWPLVNYYYIGAVRSRHNVILMGPYQTSMVTAANLCYRFTSNMQCAAAVGSRNFLCVPRAICNRWNATLIFVFCKGVWSRITKKVQRKRRRHRYDETRKFCLVYGDKGDYYADKDKFVLSL